jgi:hypothetical protein
MKRRTLLTAAAAAVLLCVSWAAAAEEPARKPETEEATRKPEALQAAAKAEPDAETTDEFKPPPGFRTRKRGDTVVYCRKEIQLGSRFPVDKCYDEAGIRELRTRPNWSESIKACGKSGCTTP